MTELTEGLAAAEEPAAENPAPPPTPRSPCA